MSRVRAWRISLLTGAMICAMAASADGASATTFYVNGSVTASGDCLSPASACKKVHEAIIKARAVPDTATIEVAAGTYLEDIQINAEGDAGLTIDGAGSGTSGATVVEGESGAPTIAAMAPGNPGPTTLENLRIVNPVGDEETALLARHSSLLTSNVTIDMQDSISASAAVLVEHATAALDQLTVAGPWTGPAVIGVGSVAITKSSLTTTSAPVLIFEQSPEGGGRIDSLSDSTVKSATAPIGIESLETDLTIDSSLLLGATKIGVEWTHAGEKQGELTIAGSTIDAGALGVRDPSLVSDVYAVGGGAPGSVADVRVQGSILMDPQTATGAGEGQLSIACSYSDVSSQKQASTLGGGEIDCADGENGNVTSTPASLFAAPGTDYELLSGSSAIDSVPASAISLPFGLSPSTTDVAGNPRVVDGNGDCVAVQDKGAFELQGHAAACPSPAPPPAPSPAPSSPPLIACPVSSSGCPPFGYPAVAKLSALKISPDSFFAAPSGATIAKTSKKAKKAYGATISYRESQPTMTTFVVGTQAVCMRPPKAAEPARCVPIKKTLGTFVYASKAGANKLHFSGRLKGRKLAKGSYTLEALQSGAGVRELVSLGFAIRG